MMEITDDKDKYDAGRARKLAIGPTRKVLVKTHKNHASSPLFFLLSLVFLSFFDRYVIKTRKALYFITLISSEILIFDYFRRSLQAQA